MRDIILTNTETEKSRSCRSDYHQDEQKSNEYLDELAFLAETAGAEPVKFFTQRLDYSNPVTFVGTGKLALR
ncbi:hypothetical protein MASR1M31_16980 [Porphyromonadaceae bacterium]